MKLSQSLSALRKKCIGGKTAQSTDKQGFQELLEQYNGANQSKPMENSTLSADEKAFVPDILLIVRLAAAIVMLVAAAFVEMPAAASVAIKIAAAVIVGYDVIVHAVSDIRRQHFSCEALPVLAAAIISFCLGRGTEAVVALILLQLAFEIRAYAVNHIRQSLLGTLELPVAADFSGQSITLGEGMTAPYDCIVQQGAGTADFSFITGDMATVSLRTGDFIPAGARCLGGQLLAQPHTPAQDSIAARMADVIRRGSDSITQSENKLRSVSNYFALGVLVLSITLLVLMPLAFELTFSESLRRVITIIAIASPGAVLLIIPLTYLAGMTSARRLGIVFKSTFAMEQMSRVKSVVFEKKGTLTGHSYVVTEIKTDKMDPATFLKVAAYAEANADDPVARAIVTAYGDEISGELVQDFVNYKGKGVSVSVDGIQIFLGNNNFLTENGVVLPKLCDEGYAVHMSVNGIYAGRIILGDYLVPTAPAAISKLTKAGVERISMLSGDSRERDIIVAKDLGIDEYVAECKPADKPRIIKEMKARIDSKYALAYVTGSPGVKAEFKAADVAVAINGLILPENLELADVTVMNGLIDTVPTAISIALGTRRYIFGLLLFSLAAKLLITILAVFGLAPLWFGVLLDVCASLAAVLDCFSAQRIGGNASYHALSRM